MKTTIITVVLNARETIEASINSVLDQEYKDIEYIIVDGVSTDGTLDIIKKYKNNVDIFISEPDNGLYDAMNKGIKSSTGDVIGFLHADDFYANSGVIKKVVSQIEGHNVDSCYGDLLYVSRNNIEKTIRHWESGPYRDGLFHKGWMPPHETFFVKKRVYDDYGYFNTGFKIAADYELMLRFLEKNKISTIYIPEVLIKMRVGGVSNRSLMNIVKKTTEDYLAWKKNDLNGNFHTIFLKNISKLPQFFKKQ